MAILAEQRTYIAGQWVTGDDVVAVENPADESHVADVTATPHGHVEHAITEARRSFDTGSWAELPVAERARVLGAFIDYIEGCAETLYRPWSRRPVSPTPFAEMTQLRAGVTWRARRSSCTSP